MGFYQVVPITNLSEWSGNFRDANIQILWLPGTSGVSHNQWMKIHTMKKQSPIPLWSLNQQMSFPRHVIDSVGLTELIFNQNLGDCDFFACLTTLPVLGFSDPGHATGNQGLKLQFCPDSGWMKGWDTGCPLQLSAASVEISAPLVTAANAGGSRFVQTC